MIESISIKKLKRFTNGSQRRGKNGGSFLCRHSKLPIISKETVRAYVFEQVTLNGEIYNLSEKSINSVMN